MDILNMRYVPPAIDLLYVGTVYGDRVWVALADYENPAKVMLPIYLQDGRRYSHTLAYERACKRSGGLVASTVHRENIVAAT
jgi:hypothetical protein